MPTKTVKNTSAWTLVVALTIFLISCENLDNLGDAHNPHGVSNITTSECVTVDENGTATLTCPDGQAIDSVDFASYGTPEGGCDTGFDESACHAEDSVAIAEDACLDKKSCSIKASNGVFGDPCRGTYKRLSISYSCSGNAADEKGLNATYFDNMDFSGATVKRVDPKIAFDWGRGSPDDKIDANSFSARWTGFVRADHSETYTFYTVGDDGIRLFVDGKQIVNDWSNHGARERKGTIALEAGKVYSIKLEYYEDGGGALAKLLWSSSSTAKRIISETHLYTRLPQNDSCPDDPDKTEPGECGCGVPEGTCGEAVITASGEFFAANEGKENAFDGDAKTKWLTFQDAAWIQYDFAGNESKTITAYTITSANDHPERDPKDWRLLGSNDGVQFTTVDERRGELFSARFQKRTFSTSRQIPFKMYRLDISSNRIPASANSTQIAEIELMTAGDITTPKCGNGVCETGENCTNCANDCGECSNELAFPLRGAFYYPWYPQTWTVRGEHVSYHPDLGYYDSGDEDAVDRHIECMDYANIDLAIASWWGKDSSTDEHIPMLLDRTIANGSPLKWAMYYEREGFGDPSVSELKSQLDYITDNYTSHEAYAHIDGKPVIFVYNADDGDCEIAQRWKEAAGDDWYVVLKVFGGYKDCNVQPDSWHQYGANGNGDRQHGYSYMINPGFWRADESSPLVARDLDRWYQNVREMVASSEPFQLVVTFNEWGEGTAVEPASEWKSSSGFGSYLDALHTDGIR